MGSGKARADRDTRAAALSSSHTYPSMRHLCASLQEACCLALQAHLSLGSDWYVVQDQQGCQIGPSAVSRAVQGCPAFLRHMGFAGMQGRK